MQYISNWNEVQGKFVHWWNNNNTGSPLMWIVSKRETPIEELEVEIEYPDAEHFHTDVEEKSKRYRNFCRSHEFHAEAFPNFDLNIGAGSIAVYLGSEPDFKYDTIWFNECMKGEMDKQPPLKFDINNKWFQKHLRLIQRAKELAGDSYLVNIPDLVENIDIVSAMRGSQEMCYDLLDYPDEVKAYIAQVDEMYFKYYDPFYNIIKAGDGSSTYTAFNIWGPGKTAKIQCDFSALMSPTQFREFIQGSLRKQAEKLDNVVYHLDGADAIRHLDAILEIDAINAIQWTSGAGKEDGINEIWMEPIYDKVTAAGKSLLIYGEDGDVHTWIKRIDKLVSRYTTKGLYIQFPQVMSEADAQLLLKAAKENWS